MKNKKIIGSTLSSASLTSGCTDANDETTPISENCQYYPLPDGTLSIAVGTNKSLESLTIPETHHGKMVTRIADNGFANCTALKQINLPDNINVIGKKAFSGCSSLSSIKIPNASVIGDSAFEFCLSLTNVVIPESVTSIGERVFYGCSSLTSIVIPDSVTSIGNLAFDGCSSLTSVVIPDSVTSIGDDAFQGCESLAIYCEAEKQPEGWHYYWNPSDRPVVWGYKSKP